MSFHARLLNNLRIFVFTLIEAIHPMSATMLHSMWYALRSKVSECVTWLAMISTKKKAVVKNSTRYSCTGCSLLNHSFTAMTLLAKSVVNVSTLYDDISRRYMENHCYISRYNYVTTECSVLSATAFDLT